MREIRKVSIFDEDSKRRRELKINVRLLKKKKNVFYSKEYIILKNYKSII